MSTSASTNRCTLRPKMVLERMPGTAAAMRRATMASVAVALVTAGLRPFTSLAFGVLVPMFGLAQAGLWGARYGRFGSRFDDEKPGGTAPSK